VNIVCVSLIKIKRLHCENWFCLPSLCNQKNSAPLTIRVALDQFNRVSNPAHSVDTDSDSIPRQIVPRPLSKKRAKVMWSWLLIVYVGIAIGNIHVVPARAAWEGPVKATQQILRGNRKNADGDRLRVSCKDPNDTECALFAPAVPSNSALLHWFPCKRDGEECAGDKKEKDKGGNKTSSGKSKSSTSEEEDKDDGFGDFKGLWKALFGPSEPDEPTAKTTGLSTFTPTVEFTEGSSVHGDQDWGYINSFWDMSGPLNGPDGIHAEHSDSLVPGKTIYRVITSIPNPNPNPNPNPKTLTIKEEGEREEEERGRGEREGEEGREEEEGKEEGRRE